MKAFWLKFWRDEEGATAIEYGLIAALIAVAAIAGMSMLGGNLNATFKSVADELIEAQPAGNGTNTDTDTD